jgi:hypothetical protein
MTLSLVGSIARNDRNIVYVDRKIQADLVK